MLRIQTTPDYSPEGALQNALSDCMTEVQMLLERFRVSAELLLSLVKMLAPSPRGHRLLTL